MPLNFGDLTHKKIIKFDVTRRQILGLRCTKFNFCWGSAQTPLGEHTALPPPNLWGLLLKAGQGREGKEKERGGERKREVWEKGKAGRMGQQEVGPPSFAVWLRPCVTA